MQISSRFTIGTHVLIMIALQGDKTKVTSDFFAGSVLQKQPMRSACWISIKQ